MAVVGLCEDDRALRRVVTEAFQSAGHRVVPASTGAEALRAFASSSGVQVCVLDIGLPDADGRDVCMALRSGGQHAPVLFLTGLDAVHDRLSGFHAGGDDYLTKPFAVSELLARVQAMLRRVTPPAQSPPGCGSTRHDMRWPPVSDTSDSLPPSSACWQCSTVAPARWCGDAY